MIFFNFISLLIYLLKCFRYFSRNFGWFEFIAFLVKLQFILNIRMEILHFILFHVGKKLAEGKQEYMTAQRLEKFPDISDPAVLVEVPVYHPTEQEFTNPMLYLQTVASSSRSFGMCKIVPPDSFKAKICLIKNSFTLQFLFKIIIIHLPFYVYRSYLNQMVYMWS